MKTMFWFSMTDKTVKKIYSYLENRILKESNQKEKTSEELLEVEAKAETGKQRKRNNKQ